MKAFEFSKIKRQKVAVKIEVADNKASSKRNTTLFSHVFFDLKDEFLWWNLIRTELTKELNVILARNSLFFFGDRNSLINKI